jgi:hypothetical protein
MSFTSSWWTFDQHAFGPTFRLARAVNVLASTHREAMKKIITPSSKASNSPNLHELYVFMVDL